jgi:hypothetical protein
MQQIAARPLIYIFPMYREILEMKQGGPTAVIKPQNRLDAMR